MMGLTPRQRSLHVFIADYIAREYHAPSYEQMKRHMGLRSKSGIHRLVVSLEERGAIRRLRGRARAIEVIEQPQSDEPAGVHCGCCGAWGSIGEVSETIVENVRKSLSAQREHDTKRNGAKVATNEPPRLTENPSCKGDEHGC